MKASGNLFLTYLFILSILLSCQVKEKNTRETIYMEDFKEWNLPKYSLYSSKIRHNINIMANISGEMYADLYTRRYYNNNEDFIWISRKGVGPQADTLIHFLKEASQHGINENFFFVKQIEEDLNLARNLNFNEKDDINLVFARLEYNLTKALIRYSCGQKYGYVIPNKIFNTLELKDAEKPDYFKTLYDIKTEMADYNYALEAIKSTALVKNEEYNPSAKAASLADFLKGIQPNSTLYLNLQKAYLNEKDINTRKLIAINMERARWRILQPQGKHIFINLAGMYLAAVDNESNLNIRMKICGGSLKNKTPLMISKIEIIDINPYWNIPFSIIKNEIAVLHAQNTDYFTRNRIKITDKKSGLELNPGEVTSEMLSSGNYSLRQENGEGNSLGRLIFRFKNNHAIYLHDTNNKKAFDYKSRAISHGCIRVERPLELAEFIFGKDEGEEKIQEIKEELEKNDEDVKMKREKLSDQIPVFILYYTCMPEENGNEISVYPDIYGYDKIIAEKLYLF